MAGSTEYQKVTGAGPYWHQYFIGDQISTNLDGRYKVIARVKATAAVKIAVNMGWGWGAGESVKAEVNIPGDTEFQEVTWEYTGIGGTSCNLVAQPGTSTETIEWLDLKVYAWEKEGGRPKVWLEDIDNGDAEKSWAELGLADVKHTDMENNFKICAWGKERGVNLNDDGGWDPFPATIEEENGNHYFVVHGKAATTEGDAAAWDNQFFIQSKHAWPSGASIQLKFKYKASKEVKVPTQTHKQMPSDYLIWHGCGDVNFTEEWQEFSTTVTFADDMAGGWSFAFQLNQNDKEAIDFYFDDLSWKYLKLDEGFFVSGINTATTDSYDDLDNAIEFEDGVDYEDTPCLVAIVGTAGDAKTYVDEIMISTTRGDDNMFKSSTIKPTEIPLKFISDKLDVVDYVEYVESKMAKLTLPGLGVWAVYLDTEYHSLAFKMLEGTRHEIVEILPNPTEVAVNGLEREYTEKEAEDAGLPKPENPGQAWDNQFFIIANSPLKAGDVTVLKFSYKADKEAKTTTQCHGAPGAYMHWGCIGDVTFKDEWQDFSTTFTIPAEADGMQSIAFNMAEIKDACKYEIKDVLWTNDKQTVSLIDTEGAKNFYVKEGAGTTPHMFGAVQHGITVAATVNGTAAAKENEFATAPVTTTTKPAEGYEVDAVMVTGKTSDLAVEVTPAGSSETGEFYFSFVMPDDDVTVSVTFKEATGINSIVADKANSAVIYNLAGQRVAKDYKGLVIKGGKKVVLK
jgi:hypothetical protein